MSKVKDDKQHMLDIYKKTLFSTALLVFPLMSLCAVLSKSFILIFLTEKWLPCLTMMQLYCIARMFTPLSILNVNVLNASGRSDLFMWMDLS
jgi:O-antigen/teichoic acid export membrane protein